MEKQALENVFQKVLHKVGDIPQKHALEKAFQNVMDRDDSASETIVDDENQTPRKSFWKIASRKHSSPKIRNLPGKRKLGFPPKKTCSNICEICQVKYKSKQDLTLTKQHKIQNTWIGCENGCDYWVHARCAGIKLQKGQKLDDAPSYICPNH